MTKGLTFAALVLLAGCSGARAPTRPPEDAGDPAARAATRAAAWLADCLQGPCPVDLPGASAIDTVVLAGTPPRLEIHFNDAFAERPFREEDTALLYQTLRQRLGERGDVPITLYALGQPVEQLIPNVFRSDPASLDRSRMPAHDDRPEAVVRRLSVPWTPSRGLLNRNVALWPSHGWYYEEKLDRWEWQRARLFQTVEDLLPMAFTIPYLVPMLENAGALVFLPRERDVQAHAVVVDNDAPGDRYAETARDAKNGWQTGPAPGFAVGSPPYTEGVNPFRQGTYRRAASDTAATASVRWMPAIPATGDYAVYVSYAAGPDQVSDAHYTVHHAGGTTAFGVNQQLGGGTWIYLGTFRFRAGAPPDSAQVVLSNQSATAGKRVSADAVRFGGGIGLIARGGKPSGRPRFVEAARYYLQYAGMPDTLVYSVSQENDYKDDYQGRGEWVNYLVGAPFGPNKDRSVKGLGIPIDVSLAFHTDAGITRSDSAVGTLMIYSSDGADSTRRFPDGMSRFASRDFGDLLQTQVVEDLRRTVDPAWRRRPIWDRDYSEAYRPNVPAVLLELLSHQNFFDMKFALDPRFRFTVARAIYKGILRFIAAQHQTGYVVQPLPVTHFQATFTAGDAVMLRWQPTPDALEPTATATHYVVYTREGTGGFDNGILVNQPSLTVDGLTPGVLYSFKVSAVNDGGESLPSEILSVCRQPGSREVVLIVNAFDRVAAPATLEGGGYLGFADFWDQGVPDRYDLSYTGAQFNFDADDPWRDDDAPGHGASYGDFETTVLAGNTFDFPSVHGSAIRAAGYSFVSASDEAVAEGRLDLTRYRYVDLILGEEKTMPGLRGGTSFTAFPPALQQALTGFLQAGGRLFVSGAYVGTDLFKDKPADHPDPAFGRNVLKFAWRTDHAAHTGGIRPADPAFLPSDALFQFNAMLGPDRYAAEAPDALEPADAGAATLLRYAENNLSAAVGYRGTYAVVAFGFPFETILGSQHREKVMRAVLAYLR